MSVFSNLKGDAKIAFSLLYLKLIFRYPYKLEADPKHALRDILFEKFPFHSKLFLKGGKHALELWP